MMLAATGVWHELVIHLRSTNPWENTVVKSGELPKNVIKNMYSHIKGQMQCLWVRPLWFSTLQLLIHLRSTNPWENTVVKSGELFSDIFDVHNGLWM